MVISGALAYATWLNEFGAIAPIPETPEHLELARRQPLKLPIAATFDSIMQATQLSVTEIAPRASSRLKVCEHFRTWS